MATVPNVPAALTNLETVKIGESITINVSKMFPHDVAEALSIFNESYASIYLNTAKYGIINTTKSIALYKGLIIKYPERKEQYLKKIADLEKDLARYNQDFFIWNPRVEFLSLAASTFV